MLAWFEAEAACKYYEDMHIHVLDESISQNKDKAEMEELEHLPSSELSKKVIELNEAFARVEASRELSKQIEKLKEKSLRKRNEANKRLDLFCKRHGIENL